MSKHILDHSNSKGDGTRVEKFTGIDRKGGSGVVPKSVDALYRRPRTRPEAERRTEEYVRIERGDQA